MKRKVLLFSIAFASCMTGLYAENGIDKDKESNRTEKTTGKNAPQKSWTVRSSSCSHHDRI